jgi:anti-sigma regulatory factor (Ser/Thr protein kinase)
MHPDLLAVASARYWAAMQLRAMYSDAEGLAEDTALVVSELVTNSVRANASVFGLALEGHRDRLRIEVTDDAQGRPTKGAPDAHDERGRGLLIVSAVAAEWSVLVNPQSKTVWAELVVDEATGALFGCDRVSARRPTPT